MYLEQIKKLGNTLDKSAMKQITGGYGGSCGYKVNYNGSTYIVCGVSHGTATSYAGYYGGNWCCASCGTSSYCS